MKPFAIVFVLLLARLSFGQTAPDMASAPHFDEILQNDSVRVYLVTMKQGEQVMVSHPHNYLMIVLQDCEVVLWPEGKSDITSFPLKEGDTQFVFGGFAGGIRNEKPQIFRSIFVEFLNPKVTTFGYQGSGAWGYGANSVRVATDPHAKFSNALDLQAATVTDVQLLPGDSLDPQDRPEPELFIPVSDVDISGAKHLQISNSSGEATWIPLGRKSALENNAADAARFILVDFAK